LGALAGVAPKITKQKTTATHPFRASKSLPPDRNSLLLTAPTLATQNHPSTPPLTQQSTDTQAYQDQEEQPPEKIQPFDEVEPQFTDTDLTGQEDNDQTQLDNEETEPQPNCNDNLQPEEHPPDSNLFG
jgi:hypothetical protein